MDTCEIVQCQRLFKGKCSINTKHAIKDCPAGAEYVNTLKDRDDLLDVMIDAIFEMNEFLSQKGFKHIHQIEYGCMYQDKMETLLFKAKELK